MESFAGSLEKHFAGQADLIEKTSKAGQILSDSLDSLENISTHLKSSADHVVSAATLLEESAAKAKEGHEILRDNIEKQVEALTKTREELSASWKNITDNTEGIVELMRLTIKELEEGVGKNLLKALESFDGKVAEVAERFSGTLFENSENIQELPALLGELNNTFQTIGADIRTQKEVIQELNETSKNMITPNINEALQAANVLKASSDELIKIKADFHNLFGKIIPDLQDTFKLLGAEGPVIKQLNLLNDNLNGSKSNKDNEQTNIEQIKEINAHLGQIKNIIEASKSKDKTTERQQILDSIYGITQKIDTISQYFNEKSFETMHESHAANIKMAKNFDELKTTLTNEALAQPVKKSLFGRMLDK